MRYIMIILISIFLHGCYIRFATTGESANDRFNRCEGYKGSSYLYFISYHCDEVLVDYQMAFEKYNFINNSDVYLKNPEQILLFCYILSDVMLSDCTKKNNQKQE